MDLLSQNFIFTTNDVVHELNSPIKKRVHEGLKLETSNVTKYRVKYLEPGRIINGSNN